ncbi:MAG: marine proteobacterial sortase target protein [Alphaproteobacteria bacterium]|nr:marine proteobacterial sortase target protein [Alphaproteobacteria bacterium]
MTQGRAPALMRAFVVFSMAIPLAAIQPSPAAAQANSRTQAQPPAPAAAPAPAGTITSNSPDFRGLMIKTRKPGHYVPAPLLATEVEIDVTGPVARTRVRQHYLNPAKAWIEGVYVFPLADKSAVDTLRMRIGKRIVEGVIKQRAEARKMYEQAKSQGKRAALVESHRPNVFMSSVANIGPNETITIEIAYQKTVPVRDGEFRLRFPMVVGPRYFPKGQGAMLLAGGGPDEVAPDVPAPEGTRGAAAEGGAKDIKNMTSPVLRPEEGKINPLALLVRLKGGAEFAAIKSHHHPVNITETEDCGRIVKLAKGAVPADRDFELTWQAGGGNPAAVLFTEEWQGKHYGLVMLTPPRDLEDGIIERGREIIFVIDTSGSMGGRSIRQAKASLKFALGRLNPADRFNVIQFNSTTDTLFARPVRASERNKLLAMAYVGALKAKGGTEMRTALYAALDGATNANRLRQVVFITDGAVGNERQLFQTIAGRLGDSRLFTVGIGSAPNRYFMRGAARRGRGTFTFIGSPDQVKARTQALWEKLARPVVTHISLNAESETAMEIWPDPVPDLFAGDPVFVAIRFEGRPGAIEVRGKAAGGTWRKRLDFAGAVKGEGIAKLWAREKIAGLNMLRYDGVAAKDIRDRVVDVALRHELVTRHTSLVAVDKAIARGDEQPLHSKKLPHNLPNGWEYDKVFGKQLTTDPALIGPRKAMLDRARARFKKAEVAALAAPPAAAKAAKPGQPSASAQPLQLPQTASPAALSLMAGLAALLAGLGLLLMGRIRQAHA